MKEFTGKIAGITGAANGIGKAFAQEAARRGMNLALIDIEGDVLQEVKKECEELGA
ncbi:MAG: SDR family NAD(P)-dependent oxidoreductase, partial [Butyricicoccus sp.]